MENISEVFWSFIRNNTDNIFAIEACIGKENLTQERKLTYKDIINKCVLIREKIGTAKFDKRIGIFIDNRIEFVAAFISGIFNGFTIVGIDPKACDEEIERIIEENNIKILFTVKDNDWRFKKRTEHIINIDELSNCINNKDCFDIVESKLDDTMVISYTSGTSGEFPKGVELTFKNISFVSEQYRKIYSLNNNSKIITVLPLWHNYAMFACLTSAMISGAKLLIINGWNIELFRKINEIYKPEIFPGSPYMYIDIIKQDFGQIDISSLRICDSGGDSLPIECIKKFEEKTNSIITEGYGLTETSSLTHFNFSAKERKLGSLGRVVENVECKIKNLQENDVKVGEWGILWVKGPMVFKGYVNNNLTKSVLKDGWFNTNDVVKVDENGYYYIAGRLSDIQTLDNMQTSLRDVENILYNFEGIKRVFVKKERSNEAKFDYFDLYVVLKENVEQTKLYDYIKQNLKNVVINEVKFVDELPVTGTGKVKRNKI
ncbi:MAG: AMP-binding protein [Clostridia bacterium]|nr:AMP-binding protein [Clostridia bacterium]